MERDLDLVREMLLAIEATPYDGGRRSKDLSELQIPGRSKEEIRYHTALLHEAGLIYAIDIGNAPLEKWLPFRLTWDGHEFLDTVRDPSQWNDVKDVAEKARGFGFDVIKRVAAQAAAAALGL